MDTKKTKKIIKRKLTGKGLILTILLFAIVGLLVFLFYKMPISHIKITGTTLLTDNEIIEVAEIKEYPEIFRLNKGKLKEQIESLELVDSVVIKRSIKGVLTIEIVENKIVFYNRNNNTLVLTNQDEVKDVNIPLGIPTLINYVPEIIYEKLIEGLNKVDNDVISLVSEIEYTPFKSGDIVIDDTRFLLRMNDGNQVYINVINIMQLNNYFKIFAGLDDTKEWRIYLDSSDAENIFSEEIIETEDVVEGEENEGELDEGELSSADASRD